ncbi:MAG: methyltransferase domain-containing protein [Gammaproteobacteria bacterium]|nr:methyltransferase domain-containing protein [Gammaproteobacteria bacterium]MBA3732425.1 methyltransferase domain-containing protein [Gammaproteobacteria bacterium]
MAASYADSSVNTARDYYNSKDADNFYYFVWGGEDIHVGLYESEQEPIADASRRTVTHMAARLSGLNEQSQLLDIGAGFGGSMRYLAREYACHGVALNLSEAENTRNREMNAEQGLGDQIDVVDGSFEDIEYPDASFDVVWCQDAILHSGRRERVLEEVARVLKPGGEFVMTDPMQADDCPTDVLQPILDRIHLETLGSPSFYRRTMTALGLEDLGYEDHSPQLVMHYARVGRELEAQEKKLVRSQIVSVEYIERMKKGLNHWVDGGRKGYLAWGIFHFRKQ